MLHLAAITAPFYPRLADLGEFVEVQPDDTVDSLHERIKITERDLLPSVVEAVVARGVVTDGRKAYIP